MSESEKPERQPYVYTPKTDQELEALAWDIVAGKVWGTWSAPDAHMSFMVLAMLRPEDAEDMKAQEIVHVYEYMDKAGERGINGMPSFMSMSLISKTDTIKLNARMKEIIDFKKRRAGSESVGVQDAVADDVGQSGGENSTG